MTNGTFSLRGGAPSVDFVNTVDGMRVVNETEDLRSYQDLLTWAVQAGLIDARDQARLRGTAAQHPRRAGEALGRARELREALHRVLLASIERRPVDPADLHLLDAWISAAQAERRLAAVPRRGFALAFPPGDELLSPLCPVALDAAALLTDHERLARLRICEESEVHRCGWLFLDETRNASRRFCSMEDCGNRAKQRRFQARVKASRRR